MDGVEVFPRRYDSKVPFSPMGSPDAPSFMGDVYTVGSNRNVMTCGFFKQNPTPMDEPFIFTYRNDELAIVLEGEVIIWTEGKKGHALRCGKGDVVRTQAGTTIYHATPEGVRGFYVQNRPGV